MSHYSPEHRDRSSGSFRSSAPYSHSESGSYKRKYEDSGSSYSRERDHKRHYSDSHGHSSYSSRDYDRSYDREDRDYRSHSSHHAPSSVPRPPTTAPPPPPPPPATKPEYGSTKQLDFSKYDEIPVEVSGPDPPAPISLFTDADLGSHLLNNIKTAGFDRPTPVQRHSIPIVVGGRDLMACAQTGSGKTAAFLFPIIARLMKSQPSSHPDRRTICPRALVLAPTRELACQIQEEAKKFSASTGLRTAVVYGGASVSFQMRELERGCEILVATPGRLSDIIDRGKGKNPHSRAYVAPSTAVSLSQIQYLVLDEADRMLDMGFEPQIRRIVEGEDMPRTGYRQTLLFSATFPREIQQLAASFLHNYIFLTIGRIGSTTDLVTQKFVQVEEHEKNSALLDALKDVSGLTIIFVETKKKANQLKDFLVYHRFPATAIHGDRVQQDRTQAIRTFSSGETPFLIATNVAARGLDIEDITNVINYDMPSDISYYVHRIGRTGRAGKHGTSTSFITKENQSMAPKLVEILVDSKQEVPQFLEEMKARAGIYGRSSNNRSRFGGRDIRDKTSYSGGFNKDSSYRPPATRGGDQDPSNRGYTGHSNGGNYSGSYGGNSYANGGAAAYANTYPAPPPSYPPKPSAAPYSAPRPSGYSSDYSQPQFPSGYGYSSGANFNSSGSGTYYPPPPPPPSRPSQPPTFPSSASSQYYQSTQPPAPSSTESRK